MPREPQRAPEGTPRNLALFNADFEDTDRGGLIDLPIAGTQRPERDLGVVADKVPHRPACETRRQQQTEAGRPGVR